MVHTLPMGRNRTHVRTQSAYATRPADGEAVLDALATAYARGWHPTDLVHITRRALGAAEVRLAIWAILYQARVTEASERAPLGWLDELRAVAQQNRNHDNSVSTALHRTALTHLWRHLPTLASEDPPPSAWPHRRFESAPPARPVSSVDVKVLGRIRALLAKAESTDFTEEAETFTAKAQELMTKYSVTAGLLQSTAGSSSAVASRRIHLESPYVKEKAHLLTAIGSANRVRTVWFTKLAIAVVVGDPIDLEQVEMLFTSLLVQATKAMRDTGSQAGDGASATAFRRAFLYGFAVRIGERLRQAGEQATAEVATAASTTVAELLPVLARRSELVDAEFDRLFPTAKTSRTSSVDAAGWYAGHAAADRASFGATPPDELGPRARSA